MYGLKCSIGITTIALIIRNSHLISTGPRRNGTAEILWNLSREAVEGKQNYKRFPSDFQLNPQKFSRYTGPVRGYYGYLSNYRPKPIPALPPGYQRYPQSFTEALETIAINDDLRCVPRLLCELTSGLSTEQKRESLLPLNINTESLLGVLGAVSGAESSVLLQYGRAALLGYTSKGLIHSCSRTFSTCPQDPDKLVEYLNNHKGGLFRYFNGLPFPQFQQYPQNQNYPLYPNYPVPPNYSPSQNYPPPPNYPPSPQNYPPSPPSYPPLPANYPVYPNYPSNFVGPSQNVQNQPFYNKDSFYKKKKVYAERRIQNRPNDIESNFKSILRFPNKFQDEVGNELVSEQEAFVFPDLNGYKQQAEEERHRRQKAITFPTTDFSFSTRKPSSNLNQLIASFYDRTGTGELRLDTTELGLQ